MTMYMLHSKANHPNPNPSPNPQVEPEIFDHLDQLIEHNIRQFGLIQFTDALEKLRQQQGLQGLLVDGERHNIGNPKGCERLSELPRVRAGARGQCCKLSPQCGSTDIEPDRGPPLRYLATLALLSADKSPTPEMEPASPLADAAKQVVAAAAEANATATAQEVIAAEREALQLERQELQRERDALAMERQLLQQERERR